MTKQGSATLYKLVSGCLCQTGWSLSWAHADLMIGIDLYYDFAYEFDDVFTSGSIPYYFELLMNVLMMIIILPKMVMMEMARIKFTDFIP